MHTKHTMHTDNAGNWQHQILSNRVKHCQPLSYPGLLLFLWIGFSAVSSFIITILFSVINEIVCCYFTHRVFSFSISKYIHSVLLPCLLLTIFLPIVPYILVRSLCPSFLRLLLVTTVDIVIALPSAYFLLLNSSERSFALNTLKAKLHR